MLAVPKFHIGRMQTILTLLLPFWDQVRKWWWPDGQSEHMSAPLGQMSLMIHLLVTPSFFILAASSFYYKTQRLHFSMHTFALSNNLQSHEIWICSLTNDYQQCSIWPPELPFLTPSEGIITRIIKELSWWTLMHTACHEINRLIRW